MSIIIGCDEAGTGAWAGSFFVGAVRAPEDWTHPGLNDSKKIKQAEKRYQLARELCALRDTGVIQIALIETTSAELDRLGLAQALKNAYVSAVDILWQDADRVIVDGTIKPHFSQPSQYIQSIIKADGKFPTVMAASILAKSTRDLLMVEMDKQYPGFDFANSVGYGSSKKHQEGLKLYGPCEIHRKSYKPIKEMLSP